MKSIRQITFGLILITFCGCGNNTTDKPDTSNDSKPTLAEARKGFSTKLVKEEGARGDVETPPAALFSIVKYPTSIGAMDAYLSKIPDDGKLYPAMIWVTGGWGNDIGDVWSPQEPDNDQSAAVIREAGVVMMYPSQRGGNMNPGHDETCYGEIDDILAAADFLSKQKGIDPKRIYLGGHSTGGTKVLLAAECSNRFRAVFSFGAAAAVRDYGDEHFTFDSNNEKELELRQPIDWLTSLRTPLYVFEGGGGNRDALKDLESRAAQDGVSLAHFYELEHKDHFSVLYPVCKLIAQKIMEDNKGGAVNMDFGTDIKQIK